VRECKGMGSRRENYSGALLARVSRQVFGVLASGTSFMCNKEAAHTITAYLKPSSIQLVVTQYNSRSTFATLPRPRTVTLSRFHAFTLSRLHAFTPSRLHAFTPSRLHAFTPSRLHAFTHAQSPVPAGHTPGLRALGTVNHASPISIAVLF